MMKGKSEGSSESKHGANTSQQDVEAIKIGLES